MKLTGLMAAAAHHQQKVGSLLLLSERDVQQCLSIKDCLTVNRKAFIALAQGKAHVPIRIGLPYVHHQQASSSPKNTAATRTSTSSSSDNSSSAVAAAQDWTLFKPAAYYPQSSDDNDNNKNEEAATTIEHANDADTTKTLMGIKIVSIRANNPASSQYNKLPLVPATIVSVHAETGLVNAIVAGTYLTAARTAAGSALSTALVYQQKKLRIASNNNKNNNDNNNNNSLPLFQHLVVFGAGLQAKLHIQAIATAMSNYDNMNDNDELSPIPLVSIINRTEQRALELKNEILGNINTATATSDGHHCWATQVQTILLDDKAAVAKTLSTASVVVTATNTIEPLWKDGDDENDDTVLPYGCHITGVGSYTPQMREIPLSTARKCHVLMDTPEARLVGDLKDLPDSHPMTLIGHALLQQQAGVGEMTTMDYTFFKSVGTAIQDVMTADMVVQRARELNIGQEIDMS